MRILLLLALCAVAVADEAKIRATLAALLAERDAVKRAKLIATVDAPGGS